MGRAVLHGEGGFVAFVVDFSPSRDVSALRRQYRPPQTVSPSGDTTVLLVAVVGADWRGFEGLGGAVISGWVGWFCIGRADLGAGGTIQAQHGKCERKNFLPCEDECGKEKMSLCGVVAKEETWVSTTSR